MIKEKIYLTDLFREDDCRPVSGYDEYVPIRSPDKKDERVLDELLTIAQRHPDKKVMEWLVGEDRVDLPKVSYWKKEKLEFGYYIRTFFVKTTDKNADVQTQHVEYRPYIAVFMQ